MLLKLVQVFLKHTKESLRMKVITGSNIFHKKLEYVSNSIFNQAQRMRIWDWAEKYVLLVDMRENSNRSELRAHFESCLF